MSKPTSTECELGQRTRRYDLSRRCLGALAASLHPVNRFQLYVEPLENGCWAWRGCIVKSIGYGTMGGGVNREYAHRRAYQLFKGPIPDGLFVMHQCNNRWCVNPAHLEVGTAKDNQAYMALSGRSQRGEKNVKAVITADDVVRIRAMRAKTGWGRHRLSRATGISRYIIDCVIHGKTWRHVG